MVSEFVPVETTEPIVAEEVEQNMEQALEVGDENCDDVQVGKQKSEQEYVSLMDQSNFLGAPAEECTVWLSRGSKLPTCPVVIGAGSCDALLDSGSNVSFISNDYCTKQ